MASTDSMTGTSLYITSRGGLRMWRRYLVDPVMLMRQSYRGKRKAWVPAFLIVFIIYLLIERSGVQRKTFQQFRHSRIDVFYKSSYLKLLKFKDIVTDSLSLDDKSELKVHHSKALLIHDGPDLAQGPADPAPQSIHGKVHGVGVDKSDFVFGGARPVEQNPAANINQVEGCEIAGHFKTINKDATPEILQSCNRVMFTHIPEVGEEAVKKMLMTHSASTRSYTYRSVAEWRKTFTGDIKNEYMTASEPILYSYSGPYYNMKKWSEEVKNIPVYVTVVRDPIQWLQAAYAKMTLNDKNPVSLDECIKEGIEADCLPEQTQMSYLCGEEGHCLEGSLHTLEQAKSNVENQYLLVGTTDDIHIFLSGLELALPHLMSQLKKTFTKDMSIFNNEVLPKANQVISAEALHLLKTQYMVNEFDFYEFVKERFDKVMKKLKQLGRPGIGAPAASKTNVKPKPVAERDMNGMYNAQPLPAQPQAPPQPKAKVKVKKTKVKKFRNKYVNRKR